MPQTRKKIGIFLGRMQPQHQGHEDLIETVFKENDEVVLCIGSAQTIKKSDPARARNPLSASTREKKLRHFLRTRNFTKSYSVVRANDIEPESAWPPYLKECCRLDDNNLNTIYFSDPIAKEYEQGLQKAGFKVKFTPRKKFVYKTKKNTLHIISSATEIRLLKNISK